MVIEFEHLVTGAIAQGARVLRERNRDYTQKNMTGCRTIWRQLNNMHAWNWTNSKPKNKNKVIQTLIRRLSESDMVCEELGGERGSIQYEDQRINNESVRRGKSANELCLMWTNMNLLIMTDEWENVVLSFRRPFDWCCPVLDWSRGDWLNALELATARIKMTMPLGTPFS